ncbi:MAG TPA: hypothetical protein VG367_15535 [Mucilaginibacter sp.]|jgi:hypothetical protein|nr:hypothetical protein [Mucilaginibacter sp.]
MKPYLLLFSLCFITASGCKKSSPINPGTGPDVYVSGYVTYHSGLNAAAYWKNGTAILLAGASLYSNAQAISVQGNTIYAAGYTTAGNGKPVATVWKNNVATKLTDTLYNSVANAMFVNGSDVYVAGDILGADGYWTPHYWKNGVDVPLPTNGSKAYASARCIFVNGQDIYVGGHASIDGTSQEATFWKNGIETILTQYTSNSSVEAVAIADNNVYLAGVINIAGYNSAIYWKNGTANNISVANTVASASGLKISGNHIFVAGVEENLQTTVNGQHLIYWKNDPAAVPLVDFDQNAAHADQTGGIDVFNADTYVAGATGGKSACYWKNGNSVVLGDGVGHGIAVVGH